ncbi:MAG: hypothetical protein EBR09_08605 [Proteobacteria bacterium]|nr:hypothetical protein [Pseudomonadota bacterium]
MKLQALALSAALAGSWCVASASEIASKKNSLTGQRSGFASGKQGTLVAMGGSGSLGGASSGTGAHVALSLFPFRYVGLKTTVGNQTQETPVTSLATMPESLDFFASFGQWNVRPELSLAQNAPSTLTVTYDVGSNLEIGALISYNRQSAKGVNKVEDTASDLVIGPRAYYTLEAGGFPLETDVGIGLISRVAESKNEGTTTKTKDVSGYVFSLSVKTVRELSANCEGFSEIGVGYSSETDKTNKDAERSQSGLSLNIVPAGLRFKF